MKTNKKKFKIGKRGWIGVILFAMGLFTFIGARGQAETESQQSSYEDGVNVSGYQDGVAQAAGYGSFTDALTDQNRKSGLLFMGVGAGLISWGFKRYMGKNPDEGKPSINQIDKPA